MGETFPELLQALGILNEGLGENMKTKALEVSRRRFTLSFPHPGGETCPDELFTTFQFLLKSLSGIDTQILSIQEIPEENRFVVEFETIDWG